jgi:hypothetical protein
LRDLDYIDGSNLYGHMAYIEFINSIGTGETWSSNPDSDDPVLNLTCEKTDRFQEAYNYSTSNGLFVSVGHGSEIGAGIQYGGIFLPVGNCYAGFGSGTVFPASPYVLQTQRMKGLTIDLKHCWTAEPSGPSRDQFCVAQTLAKCLPPVGTGQVVGYLGKYIYDAEYTIVQISESVTTGSPLSDLQMARVKSIIKEEALKLEPSPMDMIYTYRFDTSLLQGHYNSPTVISTITSAAQQRASTEFGQNVEITNLALTIKAHCNPLNQGALPYDY